MTGLTASECVQAPTASECVQAPSRRALVSSMVCWNGWQAIVWFPQTLLFAGNGHRLAILPIFTGGTAIHTPSVRCTGLLVLSQLMCGRSGESGNGLPIQSFLRSLVSAKRVLNLRLGLGLAYLSQLAVRSVLLLGFLEYIVPSTLNGEWTVVRCWL